MLFPATITNDTNLIFETTKNLSGVKKSILNFKANNILAETDTGKINNREKIKGQSI